MKTKKGFTLVEILITIMVASILIVSAGIVLAGGHTIWNNGLKRANLQRDASFAMLKINRLIRQGHNAVLEDDGKSLKITNESSWIKFYHDENADNLILEAQDELPVTIVEGTVDKLEFKTQPKIVTVTLTLKQDNYEIAYISTVMMRNFEG